MTEDNTGCLVREEVLPGRTLLDLVTAVVAVSVVAVVVLVNIEKLWKRTQCKYIETQC